MKNETQDQLSPLQVAKIKHLFLTEHLPLEVLAERFGSNRPTIKRHVRKLPEFQDIMALLQSDSSKYTEWGV